VDGSENAGQDFAIVGVFLQRDQVPVQAVEILVTLDHKLFDNLVGIVHSEYRLHRLGGRFT
jgi:hypothetical protein